MNKPTLQIVQPSVALQSEHLNTQATRLWATGQGRTPGGQVWGALGGFVTLTCIWRTRPAAEPRSSPGPIRTPEIRSASWPARTPPASRSPTACLPPSPSARRRCGPRSQRAPRTAAPAASWATVRGCRRTRCESPPNARPGWRWHGCRHCLKRLNGARCGSRAASDTAYSSDNNSPSRDMKERGGGLTVGFINTDQYGLWVHWKWPFTACTHHQPSPPASSSSFGWKHNAPPTLVW